MTIQLPARGSFPDLEPAGRIAPSTPHLDGHVEDIVEGQHWASAYLGRQHVAQSWAHASPSASTKTQVLTYLVIPRVGMTTLRWRAYLTASVPADTVTVYLDCAENGETANTADASGTSGRYVTGTLEIQRPDQLTTIHVSIAASSGTVTLNSFSLADEDLASTDLHADYYASTTTATADSLVRYWPLQEDDDAGTDATGVDALGAGNLTAYNGVTIDSETINGRRKYHRVFGASDYMQAAWTYDKTTDWTVMIRVYIALTGTSRQDPYVALSEAGTTGGVAMGYYYAYGGSGYLGMAIEVGTSQAGDGVNPPNGEWTTYYLVHDVSAPSVTLYSADGEGTVTQCAQIGASPTVNGSGVRIGRGWGTMGWFDDTDYLDDGSVRDCAVWTRALSAMEMNAIARKLQHDGALLVR